MTPGSWAFLIDSVNFERETRDGQTSLGGSESACLGLARALKARGHDVHVFTTRLADDAVGNDPWGVAWHPLSDFPMMNQFIEWDVVVGLRMFGFFAQTPIHARLRILWNQDLLLPGVGDQVMAVAWALDKSMYVSEYHRQQWEDLQPELAPIGAVTRNGFDPAHVGQGITKDPNRIIHISRPERGIAPILAMWPELRNRNPKATLKICRYSSMYDAGGWGKVCASYDEQVQVLNETVGGIEYLGELNKAQLYQAIAEAAVMWYPGVASFAETSCIAAIESQANGTPFVGSLKGALVETAKPAYEAGHLIAGDAEKDPSYHNASISAVLSLLEGCRKDARWYRELQQAGLKHVETYTYDYLAQEWEAQIDGWFRERYEGSKVRVMEALLHEDDHTAAMRVAEDVIADEGNWGTEAISTAVQANRFCLRVIAGLEQGPEDYAAHAIQDPLAEVKFSERLHRVAEMFEGCSNVLDVACGNGAGAITFALRHPSLRVVGFDYAAANIEHAKDAAERAGVADRCTFVTGTVWDLPRNEPNRAIDATIRQHGPFDGLFVGEFVEHVADCTTLVDWLETFLQDGATAVYTCPVGPLGELVPRGQPIQRGHVHCFKQDDVKAVWGGKLDVGADFMAIGQTPRNAPIGHWLIHYRTAADRPAGRRDYATRVMRTRPLQKVSVGLIVKDVENDLGRCLTSVWNIGDEIIVGDTGSRDTTKAIAASFGATVLDLPSIGENGAGFAGARNAVLDAATGDWFLWIDADEQLLSSHMLRRYLDGAIYKGFVIHQHHLQMDAGPSFDIPVRLFRKDGTIRFYGCIHEQPQMGDCNGDIFPSLDIVDVAIAHTGYLTEAIRREKMLTRNLPLLRLDQQVYPDRELGKVLVLRDYVNLSDYDCERAGGMTEKAQQGYARAVQLFIGHFDDPAHKFHAIARPWYEIALQRLGGGFEVELALAGRAGGLQSQRAKPERVWVRDADELERFLTFKTNQATKALRQTPLKTDPFVLPSREAVSV